jgi:glycosyltransferase involved in cell wall biosynthesis
MPESLRRPYILEVEHWFRLSGAMSEPPPGTSLHMRPLAKHDITASGWDEMLSRLDLVNERFSEDQCRAILTLSPGMVEHFKQFLAPELWPKLRFLYPAAPTPPVTGSHNGDVFRILTVASRFSDKGVPEVLQAFEQLRARHGKAVELMLLCHQVPARYRPLPDGTTLYDDPPFIPASRKHQIFGRANAMCILNFWEGPTSIMEANSYGVPSVTTRVHNGEAFVREGITGYLVDPPFFAYSEGFGSRWKSLTDLSAELEELRKRGGMAALVDDVVDRLDRMITGEVDHRALGDAARELHAERFTPEVRNRELRRIYADALDD